MRKDELIAKAKELAELEDLSGKAGEVEFLRREGKRSFHSEEDSLSDYQLKAEFEKYFAIIAEKAGAQNENTADAKKAIIEKAKALLNRKDYKKATEEMNALFDDFKHSGRSTKEVDDQLWAEFKGIKDKFYEAKNAYFNGLKEKIANSATAKEEIIAKAKEVLNIENIKEAGDKLNALMDEWKKAGFAGKEKDDALWAEFSAVRKEYNEKRNKYFEGMQQVFEDRAAKKAEIIAKARIIIANSTFTKEEVASMKALRNDWKAVGFAGKNKDDALWEEFNGIENKYFDLMKGNR